MNDYQPALDQLRERRKGKPGELWLAIGIACMAISPFVLAIVHNEGAEYAQLKTQGVVAQARITGHEEREVDYSGRKGRNRTKTLHFVELRYDLNSATSYAQWKSSGKVTPSQYPVMATTKVEVPQGYLASHPVGQDRPVALLRGDSSSMELVEQVESETSLGYFLKYYLAMAALFAAGAAMTLVGWRQRKAHA